MRINISDLAEECDFQIQRGDRDTWVRGVSTDSRDIKQGEAFVALVGDRFDGHDFLREAADAGAAAVVVEAGRLGDAAIDTVVITVPDTLQALGCIGRYWRRRCSAHVVAVTGSAGKTTTKDMIGSILQQAGAVTTTRENQNNEIGVPQTLLRMGRNDDFCVLEFGMRAPGEIEYLVRISEPDIGLITNIGEAHIGRLGSREAVAKAKAEMLPLLPEDGAAVLNADDFFFPLLSNMASAPVISFGTTEADVTLTDVELLGVTGCRARLRLPGGSIEVTLQLPGRHNAMNAAAAAAVATAVDIAPDLIKAGLEAFEGHSMRSQTIQAGDVTIIHDAYNASPTSVPPALEVLGQAQGRKVFVFGDMLELGPAAEEAHREIGRLAVKHGVDLLISVGQLGEYAAEEAEEEGVQIYHTSNAQEAAEIARDILQPGDTVLVKASRGMKLEIVVEALT
ncbi:MAG: UDP-N-acetylmuramoyl-tripeptide--D-alanyl-D-alanine ligase [Armatimonadota bacterium]